MLAEWLEHRIRDQKVVSLTLSLSLIPSSDVGPSTRVLIFLISGLGLEPF